MAGSCLSTNLLLRDERFIKLKEHFKHISVVKLKTRLERYRDELSGIIGQADDWFPEGEYLGAFEEYMHRMDRIAKIQNAKESTEKGNPLANYNAVLSVYSYRQLRDAIDRVSFDFRNVVEHLRQAHPSWNNERLVKDAGGFRAIMDEIFKQYSEFTADSIYENLVADKENLSEGVFSSI